MLVLLFSSSAAKWARALVLEFMRQTVSLISLQCFKSSRIWDKKKLMYEVLQPRSDQMIPGTACVKQPPNRAKEGSFVVRFSVRLQSPVSQSAARNTMIREQCSQIHIFITPVHHKTRSQNFCLPFNSDGNALLPYLLNHSGVSGLTLIKHNFI
jgi:hypothetical protein